MFMVYTWGSLWFYYGFTMVLLWFIGERLCFSAQGIAITLIGQSPITKNEVDDGMGNPAVQHCKKRKTGTL